MALGNPSIYPVIPLPRILPAYAFAAISCSVSTYRSIAVPARKAQNSNIGSIRQTDRTANIPFPIHQIPARQTFQVAFKPVLQPALKPPGKLQSKRNPSILLLNK